MLFRNLSAVAACLSLASPAAAAPLSRVQLPSSSFDGAHTTEAWMPSSVDRVTAPSIRLASRASWYGPGFFGNRTANGEVYRPGTMTAAHRTLPFGTRVRVTNLNNGRVAVVRINDRGPFYGDREIDLGHGAAVELGLIESGLARVKLEVLR